MHDEFDILTAVEHLSRVLCLEVPEDFQNYHTSRVLKNATTVSVPAHTRHGVHPEPYRAGGGSAFRFPQHKGG
jgi:hypothetical protein